MLKVPGSQTNFKREAALEMPNLRSERHSRTGSFVSSRFSLRQPGLDLDQFQPVSFFCLKRESKPRIWFIKLMSWPWFERVSILVILTNCVTLGMYDPFDVHCVTEQCQVLETLETAIYAFFLVEMLIKWVAMGLFGKQGYFKDSWNKLDCFIVAAGSFELAYGEGEYLSAVRSIRVLRPLRAINRVPSIRILVMLLLDTLPMLGNVLAICFFIFAIFGIIGVQLWQGLLRSRCFPDPGQLNDSLMAEYNLSSFYQPSFDKPDYVCSFPGNNGLSKCDKQHFHHHDFNGYECNQSYPLPVNASPSLCVDWNQYYTSCRDSGENIFYGSISFDNIGIATVAIFQIITLEGWTDIMYKIQDAHSFWNWVYFVVLILLGSYFMTNLCLVVITSQFQETKQRETELLKLARLRARASVSTVSSSFVQQGCYTQILHYLEHLCRRLRRRVKSWLKINKTSKQCRVRPCLQLKNRKDNVKSIHHHHHHYHYYHHYVHHRSCQCSSLELSDSPPASSEPGEISSGMSPPSAEHALGVMHDTQESRTPKEGKRILVVPQIQVFAQAATALYKDSGTTSPGEMVSTATANVNVQGHDSSASIVTISKTADPVAAAAQATAQTIEAACSCAAQQSGEDNVHVITKAYEDSVDSSGDDTGNTETKGDNSCYDKFRDTMKVFVESTRFTRVIMASIFLNTICMAVEHHGQPAKMTDILEIFNIIFTSIFALEMLGKIIAFGPYGYIKDAYNLFDGIIVIVSLTDIFAGSDTSGISVLRSFRLLRIFKLVRFMPALQRQLSVMVRTLDNVMTFLALLSLFIFTSSILGMHLFGGKYQFEDEDGQLVTSRANFDSLFWALVTVFQVLTQEDWNVVLYDGMRALSSWAALYFIFLMIIGNYILFNLLVAILVEGFADHTENERLSLKGEMKDPSGTLSPSKLDQTRVERAEKELAVSWPNINTMLPDENLNDKQLARCKSAPGGQNPSQKPQRSSSYLHVLTVDTLESEHSADETGNKYEKSRCTSPVDEDTSLVPLHCKQASRDNSVVNSPRSSFFKRRAFWSLYLFSPENRFRLLMVKIHSHVWFDRIVLFFILFNCIVMAMEEPGLDQQSKTGQFIHIMQYIFTAIFTIEMSIKVISLGLIVGPNTYLKSGWNIIDGILVFFSLVDLIISLTTDTHSGILGVLRVFRAFRTLRPLRVISRAPELKLVVETLLSSLKPIGNVVLIAATFFTIFGVLGVQLFKGKFYSCYGVPPTIEIKNKSECLSNGGKWLNNEYNFDNLARALLTLFVFATRDGWVSIMYSGVDAVGVDEEPQRDHSKWNVLYFVAFLLLAGFVVLNMLVGIVVENFHKCRNELLKEQNANKSEKVEMNEISRSNSISDIDYEAFPPWRRKIFLLVTHDYFDLAIAVVIGINVLCMAMEHYNQPENLTLFLKYANYVFTIMFIIEAVLKMLALGLKNYFSNRWNCLDMIIVVLSIGGIILDELATSNFPMNPTIIRVMRVLRITRVLKLLKTAEGIRSLLDTVGKALPQVANLGLLFLLLFFIFGALGMELFGQISCENVECEGLDSHAHFRNFGYSVLTLFRVSTGDNWNGILKDTIDTKRCEAEQHDDCQIIQNIAPIYFASFVLITQFVLLNVVVAVMMKHLEESKFQETKAPSVKNRSPRTPRLFLGKRTPDTPRISKSSPRFPKGSQQSLRSRKNESGILKNKESLHVDGRQRRAKSLDEISNNNSRYSSGSDSEYIFEDLTVAKDCEVPRELRQRKHSLETPILHADNKISEKLKNPNPVLEIVEVDDCDSSSKRYVESLASPVKYLEPLVKPSEPFVKPSKPTVKLSKPFFESPESSVKSPEPIVESLKPFVEPSETVVKPSESFVKPFEPDLISSEVSVKNEVLLVKSSEQLVKSSTPVVINTDDVGKEKPRRQEVVENTFVQNENGSSEGKKTFKIPKETHRKEEGGQNTQKKIKAKLLGEEDEKGNKLLKENKRKKENDEIHNAEHEGTHLKNVGQNKKDERRKDNEIQQTGNLKEMKAEENIKQEKLKDNFEQSEDKIDTVGMKDDDQSKEQEKLGRNIKRIKNGKVKDHLKRTTNKEQNLKQSNNDDETAISNQDETQPKEQDFKNETKPELRNEGSNARKKPLRLHEELQANLVDSNEGENIEEGVSMDAGTQQEGNTMTRSRGLRPEPLPDKVMEQPPPASSV